ncbi:MAG: VirB3 family type IV secretion system protein [Proteobacteria bacterium]|jgi:type IV secretory pathway TrbD component|nr:VirB3 family type IV secretion system protein [Pseudomonadota bacterium]
MPKLNTIHKSLYMPVLFVGCERLPFTIITMIGAMILMQYQNLWAILGVLFLYLIGVALIRRVNKDDAQFFMCLYRWLRYYQDYYPVHAFYPGRVDKPKNNFV